MTRERYIPKDAKRPPPRGRCRWCTGPVPRGRLSFCSPECVHQYRLRSDPVYLATCAFARDGGVCQRCGVDTVALSRDLRALARSDPDAYAARCAALGVTVREGLRRQWALHHVTRVADGGGQCGLDGVSTRCLSCHKAEHRAQTPTTAC